MATQSSKPSGQVSSPTTPMGEESVTPVSQPSRLAVLSASMYTEPDMKSEAIQRAQVGSLMGANSNNEPQNKMPRKQTPTSATRPKKYALEMWVEIETSVGIHTAPEEDSYSVDFAIDTINRTYPGCTGMYLGVAGHMLGFYGKKTNPRAGLLIGQAIATSKAIANIPTWMGNFTRWRVKCVSISEASEILARCKLVGSSSSGFPSCSWTLPSQLLLNHSNLGLLRSHPERMMCLGATLFDTDWQGAVLHRVLPLTPP